MENLLSRKYIESDYVPILFTECIKLPKCFNDRKYLTAYVRRATRLGIRLEGVAYLTVKESQRNAREHGFTGESLQDRAKWAQQTNDLNKYAALFQEKLIEVEYDGVMPSPNKKDPLIVEEGDELKIARQVNLVNKKVGK